jgi:hypothetical protein
MVVICATCEEYLGCGDCDHCASYRGEPPAEPPDNSATDNGPIMPRAGNGGAA